MSDSGISIVVPLVDARRSRKTGSKAVDLSRLIEARFAVPRGFVIGADAYRSHLWASGARNVASAAGEAEEREHIRSAILSHDIPEDIRQAISEAYERLSWQSGCPEPKVAVRASALENGLPDLSFPGAYENFLNVSGFDSLCIAIKRVWASLWNGKAAAYRARAETTSEPAMAVIVQQMIEADWFGSAKTVCTVTGDPHKVLMCISRASDSVDSACVEVNLHDLRSVNTRDTLDPDSALLIAEKAVLIEDIFGSSVEVDWAYGVDALWMLQARPLSGPPVSFPLDSLNEEREGKAQWRLVTDQPVSYFSRSLLWPAASREKKPGVLTARPINGYVYRRVDDAPDIEKKEIAAARALLERWEKKSAARLMLRCRQGMERDLSSLDHSRLLGSLTEAADTVRQASAWESRMSSLCARFTAALSARVTDTSLFQRLVGGLPDPIVLRDARLQELGERFAGAKENGKLNDEKWWLSYKCEVERFARDYGFSFAQASEFYDLASWKSWVEDSDAVFRMIAACARQGNRPTLVTGHCAAEASANEAAGEAIAAYKGGARRRFNSLLRLSRKALVSHSQSEQAYALACVGSRLVLVELSDRLCASGVLAEKNDVFFLTLEEILALPARPDKTERAAAATRIAGRKHDLWLENRLLPPDIMAADGEAVPEKPVEGRPGATIKGHAVSPGLASGPARLAYNPAEAGETKLGDVLIVKELSLAWTPFLSAAGAMVCEDGEFSPEHAALAREYGIPIVAGCRGILAAVKDCRKVTVDGFLGTVEIAAFCVAH